MNLIGAFIEGGGTGYFGFAGLPFNLILSRLFILEQFNQLPCIMGMM